jgi:hypothetical protein
MCGLEFLSTGYFYVIKFLYGLTDDQSLSLLHRFLSQLTRGQWLRCGAVCSPSSFFRLDQMKDYIWPLVNLNNSADYERVQENQHFVYW